MVVQMSDEILIDVCILSSPRLAEHFKDGTSWTLLPRG